MRFRPFWAIGRWSGLVKRICQERSTPESIWGEEGAPGILAHVWDYTFTGNASVLETYISYLRHKIDAVDPPLIHTVRGVGYTLRLPPDRS